MSVAGPNVLISSAGRRVGLVRAFQEAVRPLGGKVIGIDHQPDLSAACQVADAWAAVPRISHPGYVSAVQAVAQDAAVGLVVPTLDTELEIMASAREAWRRLGIHTSVSDLSVIRKCQDKRLTALLFRELGISPLREDWETFPRFVKPIAGSLSNDVHIIESQSDLQPRFLDNNLFVHQELVDRNRYDEYTVDALYSQAGKLICAIPRRRIEVRGGEISKGRTEKGPLLELIRQHLYHLEGARGCLTIQVFYSPAEPNRPLIGIEINARFGGGYPMSHHAGGRFSDWLIEEAFLGADLTYRQDWADDMCFLRFDDHVATQN